MLGRTPIAAGLALHQDEFNVVLDDGIRFVGFAEKSSSAGDFIVGVGDLMPDDRGEVIEADGSATLLDGGMQRHDGMPAVVFLSRQADVADVDDESAAGHERAIAMRPDSVKCFDEFIVVDDVAELIVALIVAFTVSVQYGGDVTTSWIEFSPSFDALRASPKMSS